MATAMGGAGVRARVLQALFRHQRAAGSKAAGGSASKKKSRSGDGPAAPVVSKELRAKAVLGANILKEGADPVIKEDKEYPDWLWGLLDKQPALSELERKNPDTLPMHDLRRLVKLDNRRRIKEKNSLRAKA
ncbi:hypothetical protein O6H91_12G098400 [Diphasiastrum complanatum]|uniref:Uncharacterized protein n=1 Tax=Diphasiastrum complanatum TaxID=34168 RepID=A0ACC2C565_DIPCM|nr:hypothetical protein O6H91_12G098400 [Diphasiastrum complanatum]